MRPVPVLPAQPQDKADDDKKKKKEVNPTGFSLRGVAEESKHDDKNLPLWGFSKSSLLSAAHSSEVTKLP